MEEPLKYFVPEISDIRVGYEGWYFNSCMDEAGIPELNYARWEKSVLNKAMVETILKYGVRNFKAAYLTKEQIEAEGWEIDSVITMDDDENDLINTGFSKYIDENNWYSLVQYPDNKILIQKCWYRNSVTWLSREIFYGECPSINEFRYITNKLLKIDATTKTI